MDKEFIKKQERTLSVQRKLKLQKEKLEKELSLITDKKKAGKKTGKKFIAKFLDLGQKEDDTAQEVTTYEEYLALERNLEKMLKGVNKALTKIQKNKYGLCEDCKKPIIEKRLEAMPTAEFCLACANKPKMGLRTRLMFWKRR